MRSELKTIAVVSRVGGGALAPAEFSLTAGWGSGGQGGITMPGKGKTESRASAPEEQNAGFGTAPHTVVCAVSSHEVAAPIRTLLSPYHSTSRSQNLVPVFVALPFRGCDLHRDSVKRFPEACEKSARPLP